MAPGRQDLSLNIPGLLGSIASLVISIAGGYDELCRISPKRFSVNSI
jgi:hypothetical protein